MGLIQESIPLIPFYCLDREQDGIPLPGQEFILEVSAERLQYFHTKELTRVVGDDLHTEDYILLGVWRQTEQLHQIHTVGALARVQERLGEIETNTWAFQLEIIGRAHISQTSVEEQYWVARWEQMRDGFDPATNQAVQNVISLIKTLRRHKIFFDRHPDIQDPNLTPSQLIERTANIVINATEDRLAWLQEADITIQANLLVQYMIPQITEYEQDKPAPPPSPKKKRAPVDLVEAIQALPIPTQIMERLQGDMERFKNMPKSNTEYWSTLEYLQTVRDLPWGQHSSHELNVMDLKTAMNRTHYGLHDVKETVLEHCTIQKITGKTSGTVMCFYGGAGTGKTSIAKSIAAALGRYPVKIALGGMSDEAEFRGHRRTYVNARPGRVVQGLKQAHQMDPLFILDEVDKMGMSNRTDPSAALLEILDPEQNHEFYDRYLELPLNLSRAVWICTANDINTIPGPLKDRMELIQFRDYTPDEKLGIITQYLIPDVMERYCLTDRPIEFTAELIELLPARGGIRQIQELIQKLARKAATKLELQEVSAVRLTPSWLESSGKSRIGF